MASLRCRQVLVVLDNCEHLISACADLAMMILSSCPNTSILATSRESLGIDGEVLWTVPALSLPVGDAVPVSMALLADCEATRLFVERTTIGSAEYLFRDDDAPAVAAICRHLDGMPLAIELAAARTRVLSVQQIADHLHERFRLLASGGRQSTRRHQSLQAAIDWSYNLLDTDEQALMRRLSVFVSSFSLKGAAAVYADNTSEMDVLVMLDRLVDKSLVMAEQGPDEKRYRMLETIKLYAWEQLLATGEEARTKERFVGFYSGPASADSKASKAREGISSAEASSRASRSRRADAERENIHRALEWAHQAGDIEAGVSIINGRWPYITRWNDADRLTQWIGTIEEQEERLLLNLRSRALTLASRLARRGRWDFALGLELGERAVAAARDAMIPCLCVGRCTGRARAPSAWVIIAWGLHY